MIVLDFVLIFKIYFNLSRIQGREHYEVEFKLARPTSQTSLYLHHANVYSMVIQCSRSDPVGDNVT
jgi:hypothetical protein